MNLSQAVAGGSRNVAPTRDFQIPPVNSATADELSPKSSVSPSSWKFALSRRIWSEQGPKGNVARSVLTALLLSSDEHGRTWLGIRAIMEKSGVGNERTVRRALDALAKAGWLRQTSQTWFSLTAEQRTLGRQVPRRGDVGQAPNLYTVLASPSPTQTGEAPTRPGLSRTAGNPAEDTPRQICPRPQEQICPGEPPANLPPDPYHLGSVSKKVSEGGEAPPRTDTHNFSKATEGDWSWLDAWNVLVHSHAEKTRTVYGVAPMRPNLKRDDRRAVAECLDGTAVELAAKLRARGIERELAQVRQDLATRIMALYFKRDNEHLRRVKHALRDLPREFEARIIEAMQAILRENHEAANAPRRPIVLEKKVVMLEQKAQAAKAESAAQLKKADEPEKPLPVSTAREARRIIEALNAPSSRPEPAKRNNIEPASSKTTEDVTSAPQLVQRSLGRAGAPRWGALPPTPTKHRVVSRLQLREPEEVPEDVELELRE